MADAIVILIILAALAAAIIYIVKAKRRGVKCIGCSAGENACSGTGCAGCSSMEAMKAEIEECCCNKKE